MEEQQCTSVCGDNRCQLPAGHKGKHRLGGCSWTDAGAERINKEKLRSKRNHGWLPGIPALIVFGHSGLKPEKG